MQKIPNIVGQWLDYTPELQSTTTISTNETPKQQTTKEFLLIKKRNNFKKQFIQQLLKINQMILICGPSGCGKTEFINELTSQLDSNK